MRFRRNNIGRRAFRDLRAKGYVNKRGYPTSKGNKFFTSLSRTLEEEKEDEVSNDTASEGS